MAKVCTSLTAYLPALTPNEAMRQGEIEGAALHQNLGRARCRCATRGGDDSPISGASFDSFRPLGFAFWVLRRLLGLTGGIHPPHFSYGFYYFAWESILPPEEIARAKAALRTRRRRH